jgi:nitrate reductase gamma subunit
MMVLVFVPYLALVIFVAAVVVRGVRLIRMPVHLRWELYPVAHEKNAAYGGSFFEHLGWWATRPPTSRIGPLKVTLAEILLLQGVHKHNRALWLRSYPFHLGLYLVSGFIGLLLAGAIGEAYGVRVAADATGFPLVLSEATVVAGLAGFLLLGLGALGLLAHRLSAPAVRAQSALADFFNLMLFFVAAVLGLLALLLSDRDLSILRGFVQTLVTLRPAGEVPALVAAEVVVGSLVLAYIPLTHMNHFFTKWFMYHGVRWNDEINRVGSPLEAAIVRQLHHRATWNAPHIRAAGQKTWVDIGTEEVTKP